MGKTGLGTADAASAEVEVIAVQALVSDRSDTAGAASAFKWLTVRSMREWSGGRGVLSGVGGIFCGDLCRGYVCRI